MCRDFLSGCAVCAAAFICQEATRGDVAGKYKGTGVLVKVEGSTNLFDLSYWASCSLSVLMFAMLFIFG